MTQVEKLKQRFDEMGVVNFNIFPGTNPNATPEQVAMAVNDALDRLEKGEYEVVE